ncbi:MAG: hypothetical protein KGJ44_03030 [Betaproteobacteria bacterium]|nr:hypothetical protein [Betaproteobacteria bacterium]
MNAQPLAVLRTGMVTSVGMDAESSCAAMRAAIANFTETRFMGEGGEWLIGAQVEEQQPWRGRTKLVKMLASAVSECLQGIPKEQWLRIPLLLCVAERERPGRLDGLEAALFSELATAMGAQFHAQSVVVPHGRIAAALALKGARHLVHEQGVEQVLIAGADSYLTWPTLRAYQDKRRLLTPQNSNGFIPGEAAAAALVSRPQAQGRQLRCWGLGFGVEPAPIESEEPLRAEGLTAAYKAALADAGVQMHDLDFRITDIAGEQYSFKEASLALSRSLRQLKERFDLWHAADCIGETGAAAGVVALGVAKAAGERHYAPGPGAMLHFSHDDGRRAAIVAAYH